MIDYAIKQLVEYGLDKKLIQPMDRVYATNRILEVLQRNEYTDPGSVEPLELENILNKLIGYAIREGLVDDDNIVYRDLFDTRLMGCLTPSPSAVIEEFSARLDQDPEAATDFYYNFSQDTNYIRRYRTVKDIRWTTQTDYGTLDMTINLAKPEKDPKAIQLEETMVSYDYPVCLLCKENEGYAGHYRHPARQNHRIIPMVLHGESWYLQYSPYSYYNEHCIALNSKHVPMVIDQATFSKLLDFVDVFPHYFIGSNADLPIVGGSILTHDHFQGGKHHFALETAPTLQHFALPEHTQVSACTVKWPLSVIRLSGEDKKNVVAAGQHVLSHWQNYTAEDAIIYSHTGNTRHNTITPIARKRGNLFELDLALRNNMTTDKRPHGLYHTREEMHHIKRENIGVIEVLGLAVLPGRLKHEMNLVAKAILEGEDIRKDKSIAYHATWAEDIKKRHPQLTASTIDDVLLEEIGQTFCHILEDCGVFKQTEQGQADFHAFIQHMGGVIE